MSAELCPRCNKNHCCVGRTVCEACAELPAEPFLWLQGDEYSAKAKCGCLLTFRDGDPAFFMCKEHSKIDDPDQISVTWSVYDVIECAKDRGLPRVTKAQAREVLSFIKHKHDANEGINWAVIAWAIQEKVWL